MPEPDVGRQNAAQHADGGRFARPVGAEEPEDLAAVHLEADVTDRHETAEPLDQIADHNGLVGGPGDGDRG